jgi:predicted small lipoprotein YifL
MKVVPLFGLLLAAVAIGACGAEGPPYIPTDEELAAKHAQVLEMQQGLQRIDALPIAAMDDELQAGTINDDYRTALQTLSRVIRITRWDEELGDEASSLNASSDELRAMLAGAEADQAKSRSADVREAWRTFVEEGLAYVASELDGATPAPRGGGTHH